MRRSTLSAKVALFGVVALEACGGAVGDGPHGAVFGDASSDAGTSDGDGAVGSDGGAREAGVDAGAAYPAYFGANVEPAGVVFRVWAPNATAARVVGDFAPQRAPMSAVGGGVFEAHVQGAHAGGSYAFELDTPSGTVRRVDPYCRELHGDSCLVVDPAAFVWHDASFLRAPRANTVVYELHVGSFAVPAGAPNGTFASAEALLPELADLGVNAVELMPPLDFGGSARGWGYNPELYFAPHPGYGTSDDLRRFIDHAHTLGIAVWNDIVVNHCDGWAKAPLTCFDGVCPQGQAGIYFFPQGPYASTPWGPRLDYAEGRVAQMVLDAATAWMTELHGDGFRWDSVSNIRALDGNGTTPGGRDLLVRVNERTHALGGMSVAEDLKGYAAITRATTTGGFGFDAQWDGFGYDVANVLAPASDGGRDLGTIATAIQGGYEGDGFARLLFTENHDTVGNGGTRLPNRIDAANPTSYAARKRSMLAATLLLTVPGVPMLFMGQEVLATGTFASPPSPFTADPMHGQEVRAFYKDLIRLRRNLDGGAGGLADLHVELVQRNDAGKVVAYRRWGASGEDVLVVVNLMNKAYTEYDVGVPDAGPWRVRLDTDAQKYGADFAAAAPAGPIVAKTGPKDGKPYALPLVLGAYSAMVLTH